MTGEEYYERMESLIKDLPTMHANLLIGIAENAVATIKTRVRLTGTDANGSPYRSYSEWYRKYKTEQGKYHGFTDFSFTNRMWNNIQLIKEKSNDKIAVITTLDKGQASSKNIKALSNYEKLEKNTKAFGPILQLSKSEIEDLKKDYDNGILEIFRAHGL